MILKYPCTIAAATGDVIYVIDRDPSGLPTGIARLTPGNRFCTAATIWPGRVHALALAGLLVLPGKTTAFRRADWLYHLPSGKATRLLGKLPRWLAGLASEA